MISNPIFNSKPATNGTISKVSSASPSSDEEALSNLTGTIEIKGQGLCSKLEISQDELPNALVQRIETQYPTFRQWSSFVQLEPASRYKVFLRRYIYAWFLCVLGAVVFTFTYAAVGLTSSQIDGVLIFAITLWIGSAFGGCIGLCCLSQRFNILLESGLEDACDHLNNMKGVAFQCKKRKKEVVNGQGHEQTVDQIYIEVHAIPMSSSGSQMLHDTATVSSDDGLSVSRTMPTILSDQMSNIHWNTFCEEIDEALKPAALMKQLSTWKMIVGVGGLALFILLIALLSTTVVGIPYWTIVAVFGIEIGIEYYLDKQYKANRNTMATALAEVCNRANVKYPEVTFKVNDDVKVMKWKHCGSNKNKPHGYIEVTKYTKATTTSTAMTAVAQHPINTTSQTVDNTFSTDSATNTAKPSAPPTDDDYNDDDIEIGFGTKDKKSREERLTELDGMKDRLSEDEYYAKRAEILSDV